MIFVSATKNEFPNNVFLEKKATAAKKRVRPAQKSSIKKVFEMRMVEVTKHIILGGLFPAWPHIQIAAKLLCNFNTFRADSPPDVKREILLIYFLALLRKLALRMQQNRDMGTLCELPAEELGGVMGKYIIRSLVKPECWSLEEILAETQACVAMRTIDSILSTRQRCYK